MNNNDVIPIPKPQKGIKNMMYANFDEWREDMSLISRHLPQTPEETIDQLKDTINILKTAATQQEQNDRITMTCIPQTDFGRDEKGRMIFTAEQAVRATIDSYKVGWFQYIWNLIDYKHAEHYVLKEIEKRANKGFTTIHFSELKWPFSKFPELIERLEFLGFEEDSTDGIDDWGSLTFRWY
jgi:hypothetical protein